MRQIPNDQLNEEENTVIRSDMELAPISQDQRGDRMPNVLKPDAVTKPVQRELTLTPHQQREIRVANQLEHSISKHKRSSKSDMLNATLLRERCRQFCVALFFREQAPIRSLGFTSAIGGEGKTFLARLTADIVAHDSGEPTTLAECNWDHPTFHKHFGIPAIPGLAEWLRGECRETDIRYQVDDNLFVIPAGDDRQDAVKLLRHLQQGGVHQLKLAANELLIADLPPILTTAYGALAASLVGPLIVVVQAGMTPSYLIKDTYEHLKDMPVEGVILNQTASKIPRWIRQLL